MFTRRILILAALALSACATLPPSFSRREAPGLDVSEGFYGAHVPRVLRSFAEQGSKSNPHSALTHELNAQLATLDGNEDLAFEELMAALTDVNDDAALLHVHLLGSQAWTEAHRRPTLTLMQ